MALSFGKGGCNASVRAQNLGQGVPMPNAGCCEFCGAWESELNKGYCNDVECKRGRALMALAEGRGVVAIDNGSGITALWTRDSDGVVRNVKR